jgi:hypothetical protein
MNSTKTETDMIFAKKVEQYDSLRSQKSEIEKKIKILSTEIKDYVEEFGEADTKGSKYLDTSKYVVGRVAKQSINFDEEKALEFVKGRGFTDCIKTVEILDDDKLEQHYDSGEISVDDLELITVKNVSYSVSVKEKEEITDEVEDIEIAASTKKKLFKAKRSK